jgi:rhamnosyltransferase subunit B
VTHFILVTIGSAGDVHPFVGLGLALKERGHRVSLVTGSYFEPLIRRAGLEFVELFSTDEYRSMLDDPDLWHPRRGPMFVLRNAILPMLRPAYDLLTAMYEPGRTVVAASSLVLGALAAQEKLGIPTASVHLQPVMIRSLVRPPKLPGMQTADWLPRWFIRLQYWLADRVVVDPLLDAGLSGFRREIGLPAVQRVFDSYVHSPQLTLGLFPEWFAPPQADWPPQLRLAGFPLYDEHDVTPLDDSLVAHLAAGGKPIAFTPGSAMTRGEDFFRTAIEACGRVGRRGLLLTRHLEQLPSSLPPHVRHVDFAPFSQLLPRCAALVHHGGIGTMSQAFAAGIPQVVMPMAHDQHDNAERAERLGVGATLPPKRFRADRLSTALRSLLDSDAVAQRCGEIANRLANAKPLESAALLLESLIPQPSR